MASLGDTTNWVIIVPLGDTAIVTTRPFSLLIKLCFALDC